MTTVKLSKVRNYTAYVTTFYFHKYTPNTNNVVVLTDLGEFVTSWKLTPGTAQYENYIKNGALR